MIANKKIYCSNCGKYGHENKFCEIPSVSVGIACVYLNNDLKKKIINISNYNENIENYNYKRLSNLNKIEYYKDKIKFLLIERKHSLNYIEFIRGLYDVNNINKIKKMFSLMSQKEHNLIKLKDFDMLWNNLWLNTAKKKEFKKEYLISKKKFEIIDKNNMIDDFINLGTDFSTAEWELPKGRRNPIETNLECAKREFEEETGYTESQYVVLNSILNLNDTFIGTNGKEYKHIYFIGILNDSNNIINTINNKEVAQVKFLSWDKAITKIRPYYQSKIQILNDLFLFFINICEDSNINCVINE
jgi:8-oxo-dGTP pyrophosphatase MutT (NUDIX family)